MTPREDPAYEENDRQNDEIQKMITERTQRMEEILARFESSASATSREFDEVVDAYLGIEPHYALRKMFFERILSPEFRSIIADPRGRALFAAMLIRDAFQFYSLIQNMDSHLALIFSAHLTNGNSDKELITLNDQKYKPDEFWIGLAIHNIDPTDQNPTTVIECIDTYGLDPSILGIDGIQFLTN